MKILPVIPEDLPSLAALQPEDWGDIIPAFTFYTSFPNSFPVKLIAEGQIAGIGTSIIHHNTAWLAHIIVHKHHRNKGIGSAVTKALIDHLNSKKIDTIQLIATDLGYPVYQKLGFQTQTDYVFFKDINISFPDQPPSNIAAITGEMEEEIRNIDQQITGEDRATLLRPHLNNGFAYVHNNRLEGFYLPTLGEGWIAAHTVLAGTALMQIRFGSKQNASFPVDNNDAINFLNQHGIPAFKTAKRMWLGAKNSWQPCNIYNRIGGNLG